MFFVVFVNEQQDCSMLSFGGQQFLGTQSIMEKIGVGDCHHLLMTQGIGASIAHDIRSIDVQPTADNSLLITCYGYLKVKCYAIY